MVNVALLVLRVTLGALRAGQGTRRLFGWFGGGGPRGTARWAESVGLRPGRPWAWFLGLADLGGGVLTLLGALNPLGPVAAISSLGLAAAKEHWGRPIWAERGGAELPITNIAMAAALICAGPGAYSVDEALGIRLPRWAAIPGLVVALAGILLAGGGPGRGLGRAGLNFGNLAVWRQNGRTALTPEQAVAELSRGRA